jgi:glycosyltransferase involved in cell wall biosynthesis
LGREPARRPPFAVVSGEYVVVQDADLEYDPAEYAVLLEPLERGIADVVFGSRFLTGRPHRVLYFWHSLGNRTLTLLSNMFTDLNLTDMESCYKCFRREVLDGITLREDRFGIEPEMTAKFAGGGWRIYEVGISYSGRTYAEGKKIGWRDGMWAAACVIRYSPVLRRLSRRLRVRRQPR